MADSDRRSFLKKFLGATAGVAAASVPLEARANTFGGPGSGDPLFNPVHIPVAESAPSEETAMEKAEEAIVYEQQFPVMTRNDNAEGTSIWRSELRLEAQLHDQVTEVVVSVLPQDVDGKVENAVFKNYYLPPGGAMIVDDPIEKLGMANGNYSIVVRSNQPFNATGRFWNFRPDGQHLSTFHSGYTADEIAEKGDLVAFSLPPLNFYTNLFGRMTSDEMDENNNVLPPQLRIRVYNENGGLDQDTGVLEVPNGGGFQYTRLDQNIGQLPVGGRYTVEVLRGQGVFLSTDIQDNGGENDGMANKGRLIPLVEGDFQVTPDSVEENDPVITYFNFRSRPGTTIDRVTTSGDFATNVDGNGTGELSYANTDAIKTAGTYSVSATVTVNVPDGQFQRKFDASVEVAPEQDYIFGNEARDIVDSNKEALANLMSNGIVTYHEGGEIFHLSKEEALTGLDMLLDGIATSNNGEMNGVKVMDSHFQNLLIFNLTNGNASTFSGFSEPEMKYLSNLFQNPE